MENVSEVLAQVLKVQARLEGLIGKLDKLEDKSAAQEILGFSGRKLLININCVHGFAKVMGGCRFRVVSDFSRDPIVE